MIKMKKLFFLASAALVAGCYPNGAEYVDELDVVYTNYTPTYDFGAQTSYYVVDSIYYIKNGETDELPAATRTTILNTLKLNLTNRGYSAQPDTAGADMILLVTVNSSSNTYVDYYPGWGGYWGYPGWGWGWGWGYYPVAYNFTTGSVLVEMVDPDDFDKVNQIIPVHWIAGFYGLVDGSSTYINNRIERGLNQAFAQSPYYTRN